MGPCTRLLQSALPWSWAAVLQDTTSLSAMRRRLHCLQVRPELARARFGALGLPAKSTGSLRTLPSGFRV